MENGPVEIVSFPINSMVIPTLVVGLPSGYVKIAIEHGPVEIVSFPINSMVTFHCELLVYQRVMDLKNEIEKTINCKGFNTQECGYTGPYHGDVLGM